MTKILEFFIARTKLVNLFTILVALAGIYALWGMKKDLHPPFDFKYITIKATHPELSAEELERLVTYPIEEILKGEADIDEVTSVTRIGTVTITASFTGDASEMSAQIDKIKTQVQNITRLFPAGLRSLTVEPQDSNRLFVASLGIEGIDPGNLNHHHWMDTYLQRFRSISGINEVNSSFAPYHLFIRFDHSELKRLGVSVALIREAIVRQFGNTNSIAFHSRPEKDLLLEFTNQLITPESIKNLPILANSIGNRLTIGDVAEVRFDTLKDNSQHFLLNGKQAASITLFKNFHRDAMEIFAEVEKVIAETPVPEGVRVTVLADGPYFISQQIQVLVANGVGGLLLVLGMLALAMGWRTSLMTALGLPISYFGTFLILRMLGQSIDLISLIAMILVVGNLVDDAVIFAERYNQRFSADEPPDQAAAQTARELIVPVSGTIATIIAAFIPIIALDSEMGTIFFAIPVVVATALLLSWLETFFILPNHLAHWVRRPQAEGATKFFHHLGRGYGKALAHTLRFRYLYAFGSLVFLVYSLYVASTMPQNFSLSINPPEVTIFVEMKENFAVNETEQYLAKLHAELATIPKEQLDYISTNIGWVWRHGRLYRGLKYVEITLALNKQITDTKPLREKVLAQVQEIIARNSSEKIAKMDAVSGDRGGGERIENIARVEIRGHNETEFAAAQRELIKTIPTLELVQEHVPPENVQAERFQFAINPLSLSAAGMSRDDLRFQIQAMTGTAEVLEHRQNGRWLSVYLEPKDLSSSQGKIDPTRLSQLRVQSSRHEDSFAVTSLGSWSFGGMTEEIRHKNGERVLQLDFNFDGEKTNEQVVKAAIEKQLAELRGKYPSLTLSTEDANAQDKAGREWILKVVLWAALLIYLILALTLQSWTQPMIVGLPIPFAIIGVIWALKAHNLPLGLMSMIGLIGTMGVAVNDSIVMVHQINLLCKEVGRRTKELIIQGAVSRLRAITLTASCTLVGVFPTAYGVAGESGFTQPLAFAMGWGLTASLGLTLFIIPGMLMIFEDVRRGLQPILKKWQKSKPNSEDFSITGSINTPFLGPGERQSSLNLRNESSQTQF